MTENSRRDQDFASREDAATRTIRRDAEKDSPITTVGYVPGTDQARAFPGDEKFPFVKDVPDVTGAFDYRTPLIDGVIQFLPIVTTPAVNVGWYEVGPEIDVRGIRTLVFAFLYTTSVPGENTLPSALCSIIPEVLIDGVGARPEYWSPIGVVDPTLIVPGVVPGLAARNAYATELRLEPLKNTIPPFPKSTSMVLTLVFDVSGYRAFRLLMAELVVAQSQPLPEPILEARYYLQR